MKIRIVACLMFILTSLLWGQDPPTMARGASEGALDSLDQVNLRNGNVNVRIPIGPTIPIGGKLKFGLTLFYNSKVWDNEGGVYSLPHIGTIPDSYPNRSSNAGIGWTLTLGKLIPPRPHTTDPQNHTSQWMYLSPDGSQHLFYAQLHENDPVDANIHYTRDGSYFRLVGGSPGNAHQLEAPDGTIYIFDTQNRLVKIQDRFQSANTVDISYQVDQATGDEDWTIEDKHQRTWVLHWRKIVVSGQHSIPEEHRTYDQLLAVEVPAPGGGRVTYDFTYERRRVAMGCFAPDPENFPAEIEFLTRILFPDADGSGPQGRQYYNMVYYDDPVSNPGATDGSPGANYFNCANSALQVLTIPSGGQLKYEYQNFVIRPHCTTPNESTEFYTNKTPWVIRRTYEDGQGAIQSQWAYQYKVSNPNEGTATDCDDPNNDKEQASEVLTTRIIDPKGDRSYHFFSIWPLADVSDHGFDIHDYQLPYLKPDVPISQEWLVFGPPNPNQVPDFIDSGGRYLSSVVFDCDSESNPESCRLYRSQYVLYESENPLDSNYDVGEADAMAADRNARVVSTRTVYHYEDENGVQTNSVTTDFSKFDGLGHFREITVSGYPDPTPRIHKTTYNPDFPDLVLNGNHVPLTNTVWPAADPWVLDTYTSMEKSEGNQCLRSEYLFDESTGFLEKHRQLADLSCPPQRSANDLLTVYTHDPSGNIDSTTRYGGDHQALPDQPLANLLPDQSVYRSEFEFAFGIQTQQKEIDPNGQVYFLGGTKTIDQNSGLTMGETSPSGVSVAYGYDRLGRLILIDEPEPFADQIMTYFNATPSLGPKQTTTLEHGGVLTKVHVQQDSFGRNLNEYRLMPNGNFSRTDIAYNEMGYVDQVSTPYPVAAIGAGGTPPGFTQYLDYDPMGLAKTVIAPDGNVLSREIRVNYLLKEQQSVRTGISQQTTVTKQTFTNDQGQIVQVVEGPASTNITSNYDYDVSGNLISAQISGGGLQQTRLFTFDGRSFLLKERHPEKGTNGNDWVTYGDYDPLGNAGFKIDGPSQLRYLYDPMARLTQVWDLQQNRIMLENIYANQNLEGGQNRVVGKLFQTKRHNYPPQSNQTSQDHVITESYFYRNPLGHLTELRTRSSEGVSFTQHFDYNQLGDMAEWTYPNSNNPATAGDPVQQVNLNYAHGVLETMQNQRDGQASEYLLRDTTYLASGLIYKKVHGNFVSDFMPQDISGMARPQQIYTEGADQNWDSGPYRYDGAGNIWRLGDDYFAYDAVSRLSQILRSGSNIQYQYDSVGNLTQQEGNSISVNTSSNRISEPGYQYDAAGQLLDTPIATYTYDALGMIQSGVDAQGEQRYVYGPGNERIAIQDQAQQASLWTLRGPDHRVVREYAQTGQRSWQVEKDYFYAKGLLASFQYQDQSRRHYHLDHLGTPRMSTDESGQIVSTSDFLPFGEEVTAGAPGERLKFTGHERDFDDQDYMHARFYNGLDGRFLTPDPILGSVDSSQSWNRYTYALNNPLKYIDPTGLIVVPTSLFVVINEIIEELNIQPADPAFSEIFGEEITVTARDPIYEMVSFNPTQSTIYPYRQQTFIGPRNSNAPILTFADLQRMQWDEKAKQWGVGINPGRDAFVGFTTAGTPHPFAEEFMNGGEHVAPHLVAGHLTYNMLSLSRPSAVRANAYAPGPGAAKPAPLPVPRFKK